MTSMKPDNLLDYEITELRQRAVDLAIRATPVDATYEHAEGDHIDRVMDAAEKIETFLRRPLEMRR